MKGSKKPESKELDKETLHLPPVSLEQICGLQRKCCGSLCNFYSMIGVESKH